MWGWLWLVHDSKYKCALTTAALASFPMSSRLDCTEHISNSIYLQLLFWETLEVWVWVQCVEGSIYSLTPNPQYLGLSSGIWTGCLIPEPYNGEIIRLLFTCVHLHSLVKLWLHINPTFDLLEIEIGPIGKNSGPSSTRPVQHKILKSWRERLTQGEDKR